MAKSTIFPISCSFTPRSTAGTRVTDKPISASRSSARQQSASRRRGFLCRTTLLDFCLPVLLLIVGCEKKAEKPQAGPPEVNVAEAMQQNVPIFEEWVSQLNGPVNADITPKVQGYLLKQNYQNGYFVKKGELLFELDPRQYQAALEHAQADVDVALAGLS